jgi:nucleoside permease NupC
MSVKTILLAALASLLSFGLGGVAWHTYLTRDSIIVEKQVLGEFLGYAQFLERAVVQCQIGKSL